MLYVNYITIKLKGKNECMKHMVSPETMWGSPLLCLVTQSRPTLCNLMDCSPPGSSVHRSSPGKNTGVGCHVMAQALPSLQSFNFIFLFWKVSENMCLEAFGINWGQKTKFLPLISGEVKLNPRPWLPGSTFFHTGSDLRTKNNNRNGDYRCDHHQL